MSLKKITSLIFPAVLNVMTAGAVEQATVAYWEFTTGYDEVKTGSKAIYIPNDDGWAASANQKWTTLQPYFQPNSCALSPDDCSVTLHTSDGKWQLTSSGSTPNFLLRLNTASTNRFTSKENYTDGSKHDQYFEITMPTTELANVKLNFAIGDGSSSSTPFGVVYSTDGGQSWRILEDYISGSHWNTYNDATYALDADNLSSLIIRILIQSATKTSNYNLKYVNILADDFKAPVLKSLTPADGETNVIPSGKITLEFNESVVIANGGGKGSLTNNATWEVCQLDPVIKNSRVVYEFKDLDLVTPYTFSVPANSFADLSGNVCETAYSLTFTTADRRPVPPPVLDSKNRLWYNRPAAAWEEALPLGNGRLGAMVSGSVAVDTIQLNEDTFWGQSPNTNYNSDALAVLDQVRTHIFNKEYAEAQKLAIPKWMSKGSHGAQYQGAGCVLLTFPGHRFNDEEAGTTQDAKDAEAYVRDLDLSRAVTTTSYEIDGVRYTREVFTSFSDNVTIIRLEASEPGKLNFDVCYAAPIKDNMAKLGVNTITSDGMIKASLVPARAKTENVDNKLNCFTFIKVVNEGGTQTSSNRKIMHQGLVAGNSSAPSISIKEANTATIIISSATNFVNYNDISADAESKALGYISDYLAENPDYNTSLSNHVEAYSRQFGRVELNLGKNPEKEVKNTEQRIKEFYSDSNDPGLVSNYFQFGRYLLISSSQPGTQPANLQGIWNPNARQYPAWDSKYTSNINVEMNYWPAEITNLSECHDPFIEMVKDVSVTGAETAKQMYGARGWVLHHNTDLWRTTGAVDNGSVGIWPTCNAWFCSHLWEKYLFSGDKTYLEEIYPVMKGCSEFFQDFLVEDPNTGYMVVCPSNSPENHPGLYSYTNDSGSSMNCALFGGVAMDNQMVYDVLKNTAQAARILDKDSGFADELDLLRGRLTPYKIGKYGQVQEWQEDWDRESTSHRHISHLWGAYPGNQISPYENQTLFQGAHKSLVGRGDAARGWSMGWKVCLWARMLDGDHALSIIRNQLRLVSPDITMSDPNGGTYANMFDSHAPFQIDGNFGCCAGIAEMLLQSHSGFVYLLPALPGAWKDGEICGLRARGGFEITDMQWKNGEIESVKVKSTIGGNLRLRSRTQLVFADGRKLSEATGTNSNDLTQPYGMPEPIVVNMSKISETKLDETFVYDIPTLPGEEIELVASNGSAIIDIYDQAATALSDEIRYNVLGQRVSDSYKGLVIVKGKKYIVK